MLILKAECLQQCHLHRIEFSVMVLRLNIDNRLEVEETQEILVMHGLWTTL